MRIIISNRKGGVGKTWLSTVLASAMAVLGYRVLLVDTDPQGQCATSFGIPAMDGLFKLIVDGAAWEEVLLQVPEDRYTTADNPAKGHLHLLPGAKKTSVIPMLVKGISVLSRKLSEVERNYDLILMDTPPTVTMFDASVYMAADAALLVTKMETLNIDGLMETMRQMEEITVDRAGYNLPPLSLVGVVPNMVRDTSNDHVIFDEIKDFMGDKVWSPIPQHTLYTEPARFGKSIFAYAPTATETQKLWRLVRRFEAEVMRHAVES